MYIYIYIHILYILYIHERMGLKSTIWWGFGIYCDIASNMTQVFDSRPNYFILCAEMPDFGGFHLQTII